MAGGKTREIKRRIGSVKNTHQITKAMDIVSSTKFKRFHKIVLDSRPYSEGINNILKNISRSIKSEKHPLFEGKDVVKKIGIIVVTSDRGLCGSYNSAIIKEMTKFIEKNDEKSVSIIAVGKKVTDFCRRKELDMKAQYIQLIPETMYEKAKEISDNIVEFYNEDIFDEVYILYSKFISALKSDITLKKMIPLERAIGELNGNYIFEPSAEEVLTTLLPKYLNIDIYQSLLEATASEHAARMAAMKSATDNAEEMIDKLTLAYNRERQAVITQEISEIVGGASALQ
ncbi:MAG: ATP synthase F1 subunit gamma [Fusobacteria bacterium]|jgi:F-type H+-transporting ATPase subunit gamma|nr:ATP synthase F1 subunit gamma [Fusobacteriota bacterium]